MMLANRTPHADARQALRKIQASVARAGGRDRSVARGITVSVSVNVLQAHDIDNSPEANAYSCLRP